ncbi:choice-of-anchor Q domain-containing protein [Lysobacter koreensis]|uniref:Choice-of-anchor Q domain-containing protein n=1 Tax=Lysobacter koreensis TaxID=266122 RepID=A0ABW2YI47_9GAMM
MFTRTFRINPLTSVLLTATLGLGAIGSAQAATFFVRTDGGDANQCNGRADTAYPGSGTAQNCAWKHPSYALPSTGTARIAGGDTLMIGAGEYMIGYGAPGSTCTSGDRTGCWLGQIPSGPSSTAKTRILGNASAPPKLWGSEGNSIVLNLNTSSNVEVGHLEITDKNACVTRHNVASAACGTGGTWAGYGIYAYGSSNVWIHDVNIHGMAHTGLNAGKLSNWTIERTKINANGWAGWDSNVGDNGSNSGQMILRDIEVAWNGCGENPSTGAAVNCWGQVSGGYGDGIGLNTTGGQWLVEDAFIHHNASDGLDFLYMDGAPSTSVIFRRVYSIANAGNQIKSLGNTTIENSVLVSSCGYWNGILKNGEVCRASGNTISLTPSANTVINIRHNTITGEGDNLILTREGVASGKVYIQNNALIGQTDFLAAQSGWPDDKTAAHYAYNDASTVSFSGNLVWNVKNNQCPAGSICGQDPKLKNITLANFDGTPQAGSPVIDKAPLLSGVTTDFLLQARPVGGAADIGAYEVQTGGTTPPPAPTCTRAAPTVSLSGPTAAVAAGTTVSYTMSLTNKDSSNCAATSFSLARTVPAGWTGTLSATSLSLAPGASANATLSVTSASGSAAGGYGIGTGVSSAIGGAHTGNASATYTVKDVNSEPVPPTGLTETIGTDKTAYIAGQTVYMSARVLNNGQPVSGATVKFTVTKPSGTKVNMTVTTGADGFARKSYVTGTGPSSIGNYALAALATSAGKTVTANSTFSVSKAGTTPPPAPTGLTETVGTDKASYVGGQTVAMNARVLFNGQPVSGASVRFVATKPNGIKITLDATTGSDGYARQSFVSGTGPSSIGNYTLDATVTSNSKTVTARSTFGVTQP